MKKGRTFLMAALTLLLAAGGTHAEDGATITPEQALAQVGTFTLYDNATLYSFQRDGTFSATPRGLSGRTLEGRWTSDGPGHYQVVAALGWINGLSQRNHYKAIDFTIYPGRFMPAEPADRHNPVPLTNWFQAYYIINNMQDAPPP